MNFNQTDTDFTLKEDDLALLRIVRVRLSCLTLKKLDE